MTKRLFDRELEWDDASRALRIGAILVGLQSFIGLGAACVASAQSPREGGLLLGLFENAEYILAVLGVVYAVELFTTGTPRERWVGASVLVCSVLIALSMPWLAALPR